MIFHYLCARGDNYNSIQKAKKRCKGEKIYKKRRCNIDFRQKVCVFRKKSVILQAYYKIARL
jgi:hypothetical protein